MRGAGSLDSGADPTVGKSSVQFANSDGKTYEMGGADDASQSEDEKKSDSEEGKFFRIRTILARLQPFQNL